MDPFILLNLLGLLLFCHANAAYGASVSSQNRYAPKFTSGTIASGHKGDLANSIKLRFPCRGNQNLNTLQAEKLTENLFIELRSWAVDANFDATGFLAHSHKYKKQVSRITKMANETEMLGNLGDRIRFLRHILQLLVDSAVYTIRYNEPLCPAQNCIRRIIKVNLKLMMLYNSNGKPDLCYPYHSQMLLQLRSEVYAIERNMVGKNKSFPMQRVFMEQVFEAKKAMYGLRFQMPQGLARV